MTKKAEWYIGGMNGLTNDMINNVRRVAQIIGREAVIDMLKETIFDGNLGLRIVEAGLNRDEVAEQFYRLTFEGPQEELSEKDWAILKKLSEIGVISCHAVEMNANPFQEDKPEMETDTETRTNAA